VPTPSVTKVSDYGRVFIIGLGACTPVGLRAFPAFAAIRAGISRIAGHPFIRDKKGEPFSVATVPNLGSAERHRRLYELACRATQEALESVTAAEPLVKPVVHIGLPEVSRHFSRDAGLSLSRALTDCFSSAHPGIEFRPWFEGTAAGLLALQDASDRIQDGKSECEFVAGVDSFIDADLLESLDLERRIASSSNRWGFPPGEGAAVVTIGNQDFARRRGLRTYARVLSVATAYEPKNMHSNGVCLGEALGAVFSGAVEKAGVRITNQFCDIDGDRYREHELSYAILRVPGTTFQNATDYVAPADCWGNCGAATAPLLTLLPVGAKARLAPIGRFPMVWCGSENGRRGAMVLDLESGG